MLLTVSGQASASILAVLIYGLNNFFLQLEHLNSLYSDASYTYGSQLLVPGEASERVWRKDCLHAHLHDVGHCSNVCVPCHFPRSRPENCV